MPRRPVRMLAAIAAGLALVLTLIAPPTSLPSASARGPQQLSPPGTTASTPARPQIALLQLTVPPMALAERDWSQAQRNAAIAAIDRAQERLANQITARGGIVLARYSHAAAALAVAVDQQAAPTLTALPGVRAVLPIGDYAATQSPTAAGSVDLAALSALIGADEVRERGRDGRGITVAVVDTGIDYTHRKLGGPGQVADYFRAICGVPDPRPGDPGCANGVGRPPADLFPNAKVLGGYDYVGDVWPRPDPRCGTRVVCELPDPNPIDLNGHGTHVADIAAGLPSAPDAGDAGVAPGAGLYAFKACNGSDGLCNGIALLSAIDAALDLDGSDRGRCTPGVSPNCKAYDPADVINLSLSYRHGQPEDALALFADMASYYGSLVVAAAGNDGDQPYIVGAPASAAAVLAVAESRLPDAAGEGIAEDSSRGPRINDSRLKPDLAAPGAIRSARAGSGDEVAPFGGSSGSAPVAAGVAALILQELKAKAPVGSPGLGVGEAPRLSLAPLAKSVLMNSADPLRDAQGQLLPLSRQGTGRVDALGAFTSRTLAWDVTQLAAVATADPELARCSVTPLLDLLRYMLFGVIPPCADRYPGGNQLFQAWNAQAGSISYGYRPTVGLQELSRQVAVHNYSLSPRSYTLGTAVRSPEAAGRGVSLSVTPTALSLPPGGIAVVTLTLTLSPANLPDVADEGGPLGDLRCTVAESASCPGPALVEAEGALTIDGGPNNRVAVPVHVLPKKVADVAVSRVDEIDVSLVNRSSFAAGVSEAFALVSNGPNPCAAAEPPALCVNGEFGVGVRPGLGQSPSRIRYVGARGVSLPGLNAALGLPAQPEGSMADELVEFAVVVWDWPYRATPDAPLRFELLIDADRDGVSDYVVFNGDQRGRSAVFVRDVNPADGTTPTRPYMFTVARYNSQVLVLPVPAAAVGLRSDRPFNWYAQVRDSYFQLESAPPSDCAPAPAPSCGAASFTLQTGALRFRPAQPSVRVPADDRATLRFSEDDDGASGSPSQIGLLLIHRDAPAGRESSRVLLR